MAKNLTYGKPLPLLFFFTMPMIAGNLFQQLYTMVDTMVVGKFVSQDAVAAVGSSYPIVFLSIALASGLSAGCNVCVSQLFGAGRIHEMKLTVSTALIIQAVLATLLTLLGPVIATPILSLLGTDPDIFAEALVYLQIYFMGIFFLFLYNTLNGIYTALGDSLTPLIFLSISSVINIVLDLLFVIKFDMGVAGVAWATMIAQACCALFSLPLLMMRLHRMPNEAEFATAKHQWFSRDAMIRISHIALPSMLQQSIVSLSILLMQNLVNSYGKVFVAGYTAATKIDSLCLLPNMNFSTAISSYTAQNIGANRYDRINPGIRACLTMACCFCVVITIVIYLFGSQLLSLFLEPGTAGSAMSYGLDYMHIVSLFYPLMAMHFVLCGFLRGTGSMRLFTITSMSNLLSRAAIAYILAYFMGSAAIWWSIPAGWFIGCCFSITFFRKGDWKKSKIK